MCVGNIDFAFYISLHIMILNASTFGRIRTCGWKYGLKMFLDVRRQWVVDSNDNLIYLPVAYILSLSRFVVPSTFVS